MHYENAHDVTTSDSGNYYSYTYITNQISDSFNTKQKNSHNGHGRASGAGCLVPLLLGLIPLVLIIMGCNILMGWLT